MENKDIDLKLQDSECQCQICKDMCKRPCWPTPEEAEKLINAGHIKKLMLDYYFSDNDIELLCPALIGYEGKEAPFFPVGKCIFQDISGLCELHDLNLKPTEGRKSICSRKDIKIHQQLHKDIAMLWDSEIGKNIIKKWKTVINYNGE